MEAVPGKYSDRPLGVGRLVISTEVQKSEANNDVFAEVVLAGMHTYTDIESALIYFEENTYHLNLCDCLAICFYIQILAFITDFFYSEVWLKPRYSWWRWLTGHPRIFLLLNDWLPPSSRTGP